MDGAAIARLGLVVHPSRALSAALETIERWSAEHGVDVVQVPATGQDRRVAEPGDPAACDVIVALVRDGAGQVTAEVRVDGELFIRFAGDGVVVATQLGSSACTLAAGGPLLASGHSGLVLTPLLPHGGCCPPLVAGAESRLSIELHPGNCGARIELDGHV
jgi:hypothetical protein